ncbi:GAF domain-containing protein [Fredinandcohnia humi]
MQKSNVVVIMKEYASNKRIKDLLKIINPLLTQKEDNIRVHLESLVNNLITEEEYRVIETKMKLGKLCLDLEKIIPYSYATLLFYDKEENKIYHGAAPNIPLHNFEFFNEVNDKQLFHEMICGKAISSGNIVYSEIFSDPNCIHERTISKEQGYKSVWSIPFFQEDTIIGTFAMYQTKRKKPTKKQIFLAKQKVLEYKKEILHLSNNLLSNEV